MSIGNKIKYLRESKDMTQVEFGRIAGVSDKAVSTWENGSAEPRMGAVQKIADYFGVSKGWIIDDSISSSLEDADSLFIDKYGHDVFDIAMKCVALDHDDRVRILERIDFMLEDAKYEKNTPHGEKAI